MKQLFFILALHIFSVISVFGQNELDKIKVAFCYNSDTQYIIVKIENTSDDILFGISGQNKYITEITGSNLCISIEEQGTYEDYVNRFPLIEYDYTYAVSKGISPQFIDLPSNSVKYYAINIANKETLKQGPVLLVQLNLNVRIILKNGEERKTGIFRRNYKQYLNINQLIISRIINNKLKEKNEKHIS